MITTRFYLDCRALSRGQAAPLRLVITKNSVRAYLPLSVNLLPSQWDKHRQIVVGHPRKTEFNTFIQTQKLAVDQMIFRLSEEGATEGLTASKIKELIMSELHPDDKSAVRQTPYVCFEEFIESKSGRTREIYEATLSRILAHCPRFKSLAWEDIGVKWLEDFDRFLAKTSPSRNARNIHLRNIRAVFNRAIDEEVTQCYPFRKFKIKNTATRKRALSIEQIRHLFALQLSPTDQRYLDFFKLSFMLCGINTVDLCAASPLVNGRLEYERAKTHRLYSIKVEPEAAELISKYAGEVRLVNFAEGCKSYRSFYKHLADSLREMGPAIGVSGFSSYWARHSWATIARSIGVSIDDIALALGHGDGHDLTRIYLDEDLRKIDEANRRVLDWVLHETR